MQDMKGGKFGIVMVADFRSDCDSVHGAQIDAKSDGMETKLLVEYDRSGDIL
jgi:hypothetical protein